MEPEALDTLYVSYISRILIMSLPQLAFSISRHDKELRAAKRWRAGRA